MRTSTFIPQFTGTLYKGVAFSATGQEIESDPYMIRFSIVRFRTETRTTSIRTDKSGSQGRAEEDVYDGRILMSPGHEPENGMVVVLMGRRYVVNEVQPKYDMAGVLSHYQVDVTI